MKVIQVHERPTAKRARKARKKNGEKKEERNERKKMRKPIEFFHRAFPALAWLLQFNWKIYTTKMRMWGRRGKRRHERYII